MNSVASDTPTLDCRNEAASVENSSSLNDTIPNIAENGAHNLNSLEVQTDINNLLPEVRLLEGNNDQNSLAFPIIPKISVTPTIKLMDMPAGLKKKFVCPYENCTKSYGKSSHLRSHLTWHTGIKPFVCTEVNCGKGFTRSDELNRHVRTHTGEKPFECLQCTKQFSRSDHLTKHLATHMKRMQNASKNAQKQNSKLSATTKKLQTRQDLRDNENTNTNMLLTNPVHNPEVKTEQIIPTIKRSACDDSSSYMPVKIKLERPDNCDEFNIEPQVNPETSEDIASNGLIMKVEPEPETELTAVSFSSKTENCYPEYMNTSNEVKVEANTTSPILYQETAYVLQQCLKTQFDVEASRPFACKQCPKAFRRQDDLNRHVRTHTGEKPYACTECDRRFMRSDHLRKHMNTHIKIR